MKLFKYIQLMAVAALSLGIASCSDDKDEDVAYVPRTEIGSRLLEKGSIPRVYADTSFIVALGVTETDLTVQKWDSRPLRMFIIDIDMKQPGVSLEVAMPYDQNKTSNFEKQTLTEMADYANRPYHRVAAMINADFWDVKTMDIRGPIHRNGRILKSSFIYKESLPQQALSFIALTKDNQMIIRDSVEYRPMMYNLKEVTGSGVIVLREGNVSGHNYPGIDPRTCLGYSNDGHVYFLVADSRLDLYSYGLTYPEMGEIMKGLGCAWASNLDGGGSAQMLIRHPIADTFQIRNRPSDGAERAVVNGWMVTVN
ncbi:MAG: phosphodiester glycosidase family protein [Muribaculaceae bacterium]|nr:phosphodiester glycosidase family protein [Muribaculaceae bacterium]